MFRLEKPILRATVNKPLFSSSLRKTRGFFELLKNHAGAFEVVDVDDRKSWVVYDHRSERIDLTEIAGIMRKWVTRIQV